MQPALIATKLLKENSDRRKRPARRSVRPTRRIAVLGTAQLGPLVNQFLDLAAACDP
jgi:hypothetical protein